MAIMNPTELLRDFSQAIAVEGIPVPEITHSLFTAGSAHQKCQRGLPQGMHLVYVFSLGQAFGSTCPAGPHRALRVGKATSVGRLTQNYIHYPSAKALPSKLSTYRILWPLIGLAHVGPAMGTNWTNWIESNLDRDQFEIPVGNVAVVSWLEKYIRARVSPIFEG